MGGRVSGADLCKLETAQAAADAALIELLGTADAMITTVLAAGGATPATASAGAGCPA